MWLSAELGTDVGQVRTARAAPGRVAALGHEARDHAVERHAVVKSAVHQRRDLLDVGGREVGPKLDDDIAAA